MRLSTRLFSVLAVLLLVIGSACSALGSLQSPALDIAATNLDVWWALKNEQPYFEDPTNQQLPIEEMLLTHSLNRHPKAADEFRVVIIGDSAMWGASLVYGQKFADQVNARGLRVDGKRVVAYNMGLPAPFVAKDIIVLDAVRSYQPDLIMWFLTATAIYNAPIGIYSGHINFMRLNRLRLERITEQNGLKGWVAARLPREPWWYPFIALHEKGALPAWITAFLKPTPKIELATPAPPTPSVNRNYPLVVSTKLPAQAVIAMGNPAYTPMPNPTWQFLVIGNKLAAESGAKLLLVNEPIFVGSGPNSKVSYNWIFQRAFYDTYRKTLSAFTAKNAIWYADLWDVLPQQYYIEAPVHADAAGWGIVIDKMIPILGQNFKVTTP